MQRVMLKSKIHQATVTAVQLEYEGSVTVDQDLLDRAEILPGEQVHVLNLANGNRLVTYAISAPSGSGTVMLNGPAALKGSAGDRIIILTYCTLDREEAGAHKPGVLLVDENNRPRAE